MLTAARTVRRSIGAAAAAAARNETGTAAAAATVRTRHAAATAALAQSSALPSRHFRTVAPRSVRAKPAPSSAASDANPPGDSSKPDSKDASSLKDDDKVTGDEWRELVHLSPSDQAELINSLPMFRHTCEGVTRFTWATSSDSCEGVLEPSEGGSWWGSISQRVKSITVEAKILMELSNYVAVADRPYDTWKGVQQAHDIMFALFNTFHLAQSRAQLRTLCTKQVYDAVEASWKALDKYGLRLIYRSQVHDIKTLDLHIHDTDDWEPMGGGGGGGGVKVPATGPLGVHPAGVPGQQATSTAPPSSSSTQRMSSVPPNKDQMRSDSGNTRTPVRYADLDVQVDVAETFELWSTRPDQKLEEDAAVDAAVGTAAVPPAAASENKIVEDFEARLNTLEQQAVDASAGAHLSRVLSAINDTNTFASHDATVAAASTPTPDAPTTPAAPAAPVAAPAATAASATPAAPSSPASSTPPPSSTPATPATPATPLTGPDSDWLPPLLCLSTISGHGERGMRFWTPLPPRNNDERGKFIVPSVVSSVIFEGSSNSSVQMMERWIKEQLAIAKHPDALKAPKPSWIIKDRLD